MTDTTIWVVAFEPAAHRDSGVGGWDWSLDRAEIERRFDAYADEDSNVFLFQFTTDLDLDTETGRDAVIDEYDAVFSDPGSVEGFALRKHIPKPKPTFVVYHPGTGTFVAADDAVLIDVADLPEDYDEWEDYLARVPFPVPFLPVLDK